MANKRLNATITIGGAVSGAFKGALKKTDKQLTELGGTIKNLEQRQKRFGAVANNLKEIGRDASRVADRYRDIGREIEVLRRKQERLVGIKQARQGNLDNRDQLRGQMFDAVAMAAAVAGPIRVAMAEEMSQFRLGTVIADNADLSIGKAHARSIARTGLANLEDAYNSQYALFSAGFDGIAARAGSRVALGVAKITGGAAESVTEVIATTFNNLGDQIDGTTEEKLQRIGDLLTKTQFKFQIRDFNQLGESFKMASSTLAGLNINLEQGATLLGVLNTAGLQGSMAGTAFNGMLRSMGKAAEEYGFQIQRSANGQMDLVGTLEQLDAALGDLDLDQRQAEIQRIFGDEGARAVVPLLNQMGELRDMVQDVAVNSAGLVQKQVDKYLATSTAQATAFWQQLRIVGSTIGTVLLPPLNKLFSVIGPVFGAVADLASEFPMLTTAIIGTTAALVAGRVAVIAGGYAWTFIKGSWLGALEVLTKMRIGMLMATASTNANTTAAAANASMWSKVGMAIASPRKALGLLGAKIVATSAVATGALTTIVATAKTVGMALLASPIGLAVTAIAAGFIGAALLVRKYWEPISAFFSGVWQGISEGLQPVFDSLGGLYQAFKPIIDVVGSMLSAVGSAVSGIVNWIGDIFTPVKMTKDGFDSAKSAGVSFGSAVAGAIKLLFAPITKAMDLISMLVDKIGEAINWVGSLGGAVDSVSSFFGFGDDEEETTPARRGPTNPTVARVGRQWAGGAAAAAMMVSPAVPAAEPPQGGTGSILYAQQTEAARPNNSMGSVLYAQQTEQAQPRDGIGAVVYRQQTEAAQPINGVGSVDYRQTTQQAQPQAAIGSVVYQQQTEAAKPRGGVGSVFYQQETEAAQAAEDQAVIDYLARTEAAKPKNGIGSVLYKAETEEPDPRNQVRYAEIPEQARQPISGRGGNQVTQRNEFSFSVTQRPGEDGEALARRVAEMVEQKRAESENSSLYDEVTE